MIHRDCERAKRNNRKHTNRANDSSLSQLYANRKEWLEAESERKRERESKRRERGRGDEKRDVGGETVKSREKRKKKKKGGKRTSAQRTRSCGKDCSLNWKTNYGGSDQDEVGPEKPKRYHALSFRSPCDIDTSCFALFCKSDFNFTSFQRD